MWAQGAKDTSKADAANAKSAEVAARKAATAKLLADEEGGRGEAKKATGAEKKKCPDCGKKALGVGTKKGCQNCKKERGF